MDINLIISIFNLDKFLNFGKNTNMPIPDISNYPITKRLLIDYIRYSYYGSSHLKVYNKTNIAELKAGTYIVNGKKIKDKTINEIESIFYRMILKYKCFDYNQYSFSAGRDGKWDRFEF
ncbi:hypothetical protein [Galbibacter pacificus]|uniref:Uncharacterized protein n=1 Tax=Galbibacter pacificus TaxID=2996052 RepID=A0ABT6FR55_9FLAO|nr:hypothetical protein [Galbibacter pacificus]MDG3581783.1 hypothetical protein [Galbibacter pacificus]MDG3585743.1 hypothetical protein [Galbibacter pacificus]